MTRSIAAELKRAHQTGVRQTRALTVELKRIDELAAAQQFDAVAGGLLELANDFHYSGLPQLVLAAMADLRRLIPSTQLTPAREAWAMNYEALGHSALGNEQRAGQILEEMLARGRELDDAQIVSTALQNLGISAFLRGDTTEAIRLASEAYQMKRELADDFAAAQILLNLSIALQERGDLDEAERILTDFAPLITRVREAGLRASLHGNLGHLQRRRGDFESAEISFRKALRSSRRAGDLVNEVISLQNLGSLEVERGRPGRALRWYRNALRVAEKTEAPPQLELIYRSMATAFHRSGRDDEAASALEAAQASAVRFGDDRLRAGALADLGALHALHGHAEEARALLTEVLEILDGEDETARQVEALRNLAVIEAELGETERATIHIERALALTANDADRDLRSDLLQIAAHAAFAAKDEPRAVSYLTRDLDEAADTDAHEGAWRRLNAATLIRGAGALEAALPFYDAAIAVADRLGDDQLLFDARNDKATALIELDRHDDASAELEALVSFGAERSNRAMEQQARYNLGELARRRGDVNAAIRHGRSSVALARALSNVRAEAESLCNLGIAFADAGELREANEVYAEGERLARSVNAPILEARAVSGRAHVAFLEGRHLEAAELYKRAAARSATDDTEQLGDLAGLLESLSAAGRKRGLEQVAQQLVDVAQRSGLEGDAAEGLARSGRWWLARGKLEDASSLFAVSMVLGAVAAVINDDPAAGEPAITEQAAWSMLAPAMLMVFYAQEELRGRSREFYEDVLKTLDDQYEGMGQQLRVVVDIAREAMAGARGDDHTN